MCPITGRDTAQKYFCLGQQGSTKGKKEFLRLLKITFARWIFRARLQLITEFWKLGLIGNSPSHLVPKISLRKHDFPAIHRKVIHREELLFQTLNFFHYYSPVLRQSNQLFQLEWNLLPLFAILNIYVYSYKYICIHMCFTLHSSLHTEKSRISKNTENTKKMVIWSSTKIWLKLCLGKRYSFCLGGRIPPDISL